MATRLAGSAVPQRIPARDDVDAANGEARKPTAWSSQGAATHQNRSHHGNQRKSRVETDLSAARRHTTADASGAQPGEKQGRKCGLEQRDAEERVQRKLTQAREATTSGLDDAAEGDRRLAGSPAADAAARHTCRRRGHGGPNIARRAETQGEWETVAMEAEVAGLVVDYDEGDELEVEELQQGIDGELQWLGELERAAGVQGWPALGLASRARLQASATWERALAIAS